MCSSLSIPERGSWSRPRNTRHRLSTTRIYVARSFESDIGGAIKHRARVATRTSCICGIHTLIPCTVSRKLITRFCHKPSIRGWNSKYPTYGHPRPTLSALSLLCVRSFIRCITIIALVYTTNDGHGEHREALSDEALLSASTRHVRNELVVATNYALVGHGCIVQFTWSQANRYLGE